jgi:hypothetical protein
MQSVINETLKLNPEELEDLRTRAKIIQFHHNTLKMLEEAYQNKQSIYLTNKGLKGRYEINLETGNIRELKPNA